MVKNKNKPKVLKSVKITPTVTIIKTSDELWELKVRLAGLLGVATGDVLFIYKEKS